MRKHPVAWFYILAFGISWLGMTAVVLAARGIAPSYRPYFLVLSIFYAIGPALAAVIVSQVAYGKTGIQDLLRGLLRWRVGLIWYLVAVLSPAVLFMAAQVLTQLLGFSTTIAVPQIHLSPSVMFGFAVNFLGNTCEEIGWRGFALPHLQKRHNALLATLIVGMLWGLWHLPLVFLVGNPMAESPFLWLIIIVADAFIYTWIYNSTKGSILLVALFHGAGNIVGAFIPGISPVAYALVTCVVAIVLIAVLGVNLSRRAKVCAG